jgi:diguanylate cyclase (GGDEF)-like protein/PAS domain S-box-containing protein
VAKGNSSLEENEQARLTLDAIGDAVVASDIEDRVTYLNAAAESLTGWSRAEASGQPVTGILRIINSTTREALPSPMALAISENKTLCLTSSCSLIRRDGIELAIEDSASPIRDRHGKVTGAVMVLRDVSTTRALSLKMSYLAEHDSLTGLPNRTVLNDRLAQAMVLAHRRQQEVAVLFLDVDRFKQINDSLGHDTGDRLLQSVAQRIVSCVRSSDTVSRQGGDEFVILLSEVAHAQDAAVSAAKILLALSTPHRIGQHSLRITASIGIVIYPQDGTHADALLKHADSAMYHAKDGGRNNFQFFEPVMNARAIERDSLGNGLRHAIARQQLVLHYQPIMNLQTGAMSGVEALIRWAHPHRGLLPPAQFIRIAEQSGFVVPTGKWVLRHACHQIQAWRAEGWAPPRVSINTSAVELHDKDFVTGVRTILMETGVSPQSLELELTETSLMHDSKLIATVLNALKDLGVQLALDDFGTGYSSLSHLKRFPIDTLKIDATFVRELATNAKDASIVGAVINMGERLRMRVVAEGIETSEQLELLRAQSCPEGQGHYLGKPMTASEFSGARQQSPNDGPAAPHTFASRVSLR